MVACNNAVQCNVQCDVSHHFMVVCVWQCQPGPVHLLRFKFRTGTVPPIIPNKWVLYIWLTSLLNSVTIIPNKWVSYIWLTSLSNSLSPSSQTSESHTSLSNSLSPSSQTSEFHVFADFSLKLCHHHPKQVSLIHLADFSFKLCHHHPRQVSLIHLADFSFKLSLSSTYLSVLPWWLRLQTCLLITPQTNEKSCTCERGPSGMCRVSCSVP